MSDADSILGLYNHPLVTPWITTDIPRPYHEREKDKLLRITEDALLGCVVQEKSSGAFVGLAGLLPWRFAKEPKNRNVEIYIGFMPAFWGRGYAFEVMLYMIEHAFWKIGVHKVSLAFIEGNDRALTLYKRLYVPFSIFKLIWS